MKVCKFNIKQYSAFATCFLLTQTDVSAEAIYSDISPDTLIDLEWETFGVDLNNDGVIDFGFLKRSFSFMETTYWSSYITSHLCILYAGPQVYGNLIAGNSVILSPSYGGFTVFQPYAIAQNEVINEALDFQLAGYQTLAYVYRGEYSSYADNGGHWFPEVLDHYLGVYFKDTLDCYHYGWVRLDVKSNGKELVIKDYAFETKCETGILAGDTIGDTITVNIAEDELLSTNVYIFNNVLYIYTNQLLKSAELFLFDIDGKLVYSTEVKNNYNEFQLELPKGIYIAELRSVEGRKSNKIYLN